MKIRTQFFWLIIGIFVVPLFVVASIFLLQKMQKPINIDLPSYEEISLDVGSPLNKDDWENFSRYASHKPEDMEYVIMNSEQIVVYSTIKDTEKGIKLSNEDLLNYIKQTSNDYIYQIDSPVKTSENGLIVLTRKDRNGVRPPNMLIGLIQALIYVVFFIFIFSAFMAISIIKNITKAVTTLEIATKKMSLGHLEDEVVVSGANEITSLATSLNSMRLSLKEEQARRSRFIMGVSHDLKTPLALIKGYVEALGDGMAQNAETREKYVGIVESKVDQLVEMIDDLIDFVKVDTSEWLRQQKIIPIEPFLNKLFKRIKMDATLLHKNVEVEIDVPKNIEIHFDEKLVSRALENVIYNSIRYTKSDGHIYLNASMDSKKQKILIKIADDGPGILESDINKIFDTFFRGTNSRREQGMGLGLAVVKSVIDSHGWSISVKNLSQGCEFCIEIPISK